MPSSGSEQRSLGVPRQAFAGLFAQWCMASLATRAHVARRSAAASVMQKQLKVCALNALSSAVEKEAT